MGPIVLTGLSGEADIRAVIEISTKFFLLTKADLPGIPRPDKFC